MANNPLRILKSVNIKHFIERLYWKLTSKIATSLHIFSVLGHKNNLRSQWKKIQAPVENKILKVSKSYQKPEVPNSWKELQHSDTIKNSISSNFIHQKENLNELTFTSFFLFWKAPSVWALCEQDSFYQEEKEGCTACMYMWVF